MKKIMIGMFLVSVCFSAQAFAEEKIEIKSKGGTTVEKATWDNENVKGKEKTVIKKDGYKYKAEVKDKNTGAKAKEEIVQKGDKTWTKEEIKGKNIKMKKEEIETSKGVRGKTRVHIKKGAITNMRVNYVYFQQGTEYILEYTIKDSSNKALMKELGLNSEEAKMLKKGKHTVVSTSPYTAGDIQADFRKIIVKDLVTSLKK
jgi:hypothetical protein